MPPGRARLVLFAIIVVCFAVYLTGNSRVPLWDRDEPRYAQTSRQMLQSGDWVVPRLLDEVRTAKPVFIYWCQASAMAIFGDTALAARLPSVVAMTLLLIVLAVAIARHIDLEHAVWATLTLGTSGIVIAWSARNALTDAVLILWITIAHLCIYRIWSTRNSSWPTVVALAASIGLAGLTKGPVILGVLAMTLLVLSVMQLVDYIRLRRQRVARGFDVVANPVRAEPNPPRDAPSGGSGSVPTAFSGSEKRFGRSRTLQTLKIFVAIAIIVAIVAPWLILIQKRAPAFLQTTAKHDVMQRIFEPLEQHSGPPGYYLLTIWGTLFPWSLLLPLAIIVGVRDRHIPAVRYALAAVLGPWLMFELIRTKLPHYVLPSFPPLQFLLAHAIVRAKHDAGREFGTLGFKIALTIWCLAVLAIGVAPWFASRELQPIPLAPAIAWTVVAFIYVLLVGFLFFSRRYDAAIFAMAGGMIAAMLVAFGWLLPSLWFLQLNVRTAQILRADGAIEPGQEQMILYKEPSLAFYQGGTIREQPDNDFLATHPPRDWPKWIVLRRDGYDHLPEPVRAQLQEIGAVKGWDYADRGRVVEVVVLRKRAP